MSPVIAMFKLMRPHHWIKNIFIFSPLFFSPGSVTPHNFLLVFLGYLIFCIIASSIYVLNDLKDCDADKYHPEKRLRPIASGNILPGTAKVLFVLLSFLGLIAAFFLNLTFFYVIICYYLLNIAYCYSLKKIAIVDVYLIASGFLLRVIAGAVLINVVTSHWLLLCAGLLALFMALAKRRDDIVHDIDKTHRQSMSGYNLAFIDVSITITISALFIAYTIYTTLPITAEHLGTTHFYTTTPVVLFGILRYLQITLVEKKSGSPTQLFFKDRILLATVIIWVLLSTFLVYY